MGDEAWSWLTNISREKWAKQLIKDFTEHFREDSRTTSLSANSNSDVIGCSSITLNDIHNENGVYQGNGASKPKTNSFNNVNYPSRKDYDDGTECVRSPNNSKYNDISGKRYGGREQSLNSKYEEEPMTLCRFVVPNIQSAQETVPKTMSQVPKSEKQDESQESCYNPKNPLMIVEIIANKKDRKRVTNYLNYDIERGDTSTCICYMEFIKMYGFDHIIIIGELDAGLLFLDCYSRVFEWDDSMTGVLWPLGDYLNEAPKVSHTHCVIWDYESDGTVAKLEVAKDDSPDKLIFDIPAT
ncbi:13913_t:CDS:2, partial [Funneliformis geosporum]